MSGQYFCACQVNDGGGRGSILKQDTEDRSLEEYWMTVATRTVPSSSEDQERPSGLRGRANGSLVFIQSCYIKQRQAFKQTVPIWSGFIMLNCIVEKKKNLFVSQNTDDCGISESQPTLKTQRMSHWQLKLIFFLCIKPLDLGFNRMPSDKIKPKTTTTGSYMFVLDRPKMRLTSAAWRRAVLAKKSS